MGLVRFILLALMPWWQKSSQLFCQCVHDPHIKIHAAPVLNLNFSWFFFSLWLPPRVRGLIFVRHSCRDYWPIVMNYPQVFRRRQKSGSEVFLGDTVEYFRVLAKSFVSARTVMFFVSFLRQFWFVSTIWGNFSLQSGKRDGPAFWLLTGPSSNKPPSPRMWRTKTRFLKNETTKPGAFETKCVSYLMRKKSSLKGERKRQKVFFFDCRVHVLDRVGKLPITGFCLCHGKHFFVISIHFHFQPLLSLSIFKTELWLSVTIAMNTKDGKSDMTQSTRQHGLNKGILESSSSR